MLESKPHFLQNSKHYQVPGTVWKWPILLIIQALQTLRIYQNLRNSSSTCSIFATSRLSRSASVRVHVDVRNGHGRARGVGAAPRRQRSNEAIRPRIPVPRIAHLDRDKKNLLTKSLNPKNEFIYIYICISVASTIVYCSTISMVDGLRMDGLVRVVGTCG